eukprot:gene399-503_t
MPLIKVVKKLKITVGGLWGEVNLSSSATVTVEKVQLINDYYADKANGCSGIEVFILATQKGCIPQPVPKKLTISQPSNYIIIFQNDTSTLFRVTYSDIVPLGPQALMATFDDCTSVQTPLSITTYQCNPIPPLTDSTLIFSNRGFFEQTYTIRMMVYNDLFVSSIPTNTIQIQVSDPIYKCFLGETNYKMYKYLPISCNLDPSLKPGGAPLSNSFTLTLLAPDTTNNVSFPITSGFFPGNSPQFQPTEISNLDFIPLMVQQKIILPISGIPGNTTYSAVFSSGTQSPPNVSTIYYDGTSNSLVNYNTHHLLLSSYNDTGDLLLNGIQTTYIKSLSNLNSMAILNANIQGGKKGFETGISLGATTISEPIGFPYGIASGTIFNYSISIPFSVSNYRNNISFFVKLYGSTLSESSTLVNPNAVVDDTSPPSINDIQYTLFKGNYLIRVKATDNLSGIRYITIYPYDIFSTDLVSGTPLDGVFEKVVTHNPLNYAIGSLVSVTISDNAGNTFSYNTFFNIDWKMIPLLPPMDFNNNLLVKQSKFSITHFEFSKNNLDVKNGDQPVSLYLNFTNSNPDYNIPAIMDGYSMAKSLIIESFSNSGVWDYSKNMFRIDFSVPARYFGSKFQYSLYVGPFNYQSQDLETIVGPNSILNIQTTDTDQSPPMITNIQISSNNVNVGPDGVTLIWNITIEDSLNGLDFSNITIGSDQDYFEHQFKVTPNSKYFVSGDELKGVYSLKIDIPATCKSQSFKIISINTIDKQKWSGSSLGGGFFTVLKINPLGALSLDQSVINITCSQSADLVPPILESLSVNSKKIDTSLPAFNRTIKFTFSVSDNIAVSEYHLPVVYLTTINNLVYSSVSRKLKSITTKIDYEAVFTFPYGAPNYGYLISVYGISDSSLNYKGYSAFDLEQTGMDYIIETNFTETNNPIIDKTSPMQYVGGLISIYGHNFGVEVNKISIEIDRNNGIGFIASGAPIISYGNLIIYKIDFQSVNQYFIRVKVDQSRTSNSIAIKPGLPITPTATPSPSSTPTSTPSATPIPKVCPGTPPCGGEGHGICIDSSYCNCTYPWEGIDCLSQIVITPEPKVNTTKPDIEIIYKDTFTSFIKIESLKEVNSIGKVVNEFIFDTKWEFKELATDNGKKYLYSTKISKNTTESNISSTIIGIDIPHFEKSIVLDPDFSLLTDTRPAKTNINSKCSPSPDNGLISSAPSVEIINVNIFDKVYAGVDEGYINQTPPIISERLDFNDSVSIFKVTIDNKIYGTHPLNIDFIDCDGNIVRKNGLGVYSCQPIPSLNLTTVVAFPPPISGVSDHNYVSKLLLYNPLFQKSIPPYSLQISMEGPTPYFCDFDSNYNHRLYNYILVICKVKVATITDSITPVDYYTIKIGNPDDTNNFVSFNITTGFFSQDGPVTELAHLTFYPPDNSYVDQSFFCIYSTFLSSNLGSFLINLEHSIQNTEIYHRFYPISGTSNNAVYSSTSCVDFSTNTSMVYYEKSNGNLITLGAHHLFFKGKISPNTVITPINGESKKIPDTPNVFNTNLQMNIVNLGVGNVISVKINTVQGYESNFNEELPFGIIGGQKSNISVSVAFVISNFILNDITFTLGVGEINSHFNTSNYSLGQDIANPTINNIYYKPLGNGYIMIHVEASDDLSGVRQIKLNNNMGTLSSIDLVSGNSLNGVYEKVILFTSQSYSTEIPDQDLIIIVDFANNENSYGKFFGINMDMNPVPISPSIVYNLDKVDNNFIITHFSFSKNNIDVSEHAESVTLYLQYSDSSQYYNPPVLVDYNILNNGETDEPMVPSIFKFPGVWDNDMQMYKIEFHVPAHYFTGEFKYYLYVGPFRFEYFELESIVGKNSTLNITSTQSDQKPPIITSIITQSQNVVVGQTGAILEWKITIADDLNGLDYADIIIKSDKDYLEYPFKLTTTSNYFVNGNERNGEYHLKIDVPPSCKSQSFKIQSVTTKDKQNWIGSTIPSVHPVPRPLGGSLSLDQSVINITCSTSDTISPELKSFRIVNPESTSINVGSVPENRTVSFKFEVTDETSLSFAHLPIIYLTTVDNIISTVSTVNLKTRNLTYAEYDASITLPYGQALDLGYLISLYGISDSSLNYRGYSSKELISSGYKSFISTTFSTDPEPIIDRTSEISTEGGHLSIFGHKFGYIVGSMEIEIDINDGNGYVPDPNRPILALGNLIVHNIDFKTVNPYLIRVALSSGDYVKLSNSIKITPYTIPIPTQTPSTTPSTTPSNTPTSTPTHTPTNSPTTTPTATPTNSPTPTDTPTNSPTPTPTLSPKVCPGTPPCGGEGHGICIDSSYCNCTYPWEGIDCQSQIVTTPGPIVNQTKPDIEIIYKDTFTSFINIQSLKEVGTNGKIVNEFKFDTKWEFKEMNTEYGKKYLYTTKISKNTTESNISSTIIGIDIPHFEKSIVLDPDFSLLTDTRSANTKSNSKCSSSSSKKFSSAVLAGIIVGSVAGGIILIIVIGTFLIGKRGRFYVLKKSIKIKMAKVFNNPNNDT